MKPVVDTHVIEEDAQTKQFSLTFPFVPSLYILVGSLMCVDYFAQLILAIVIKHCVFLRPIVMRRHNFFPNLPERVDVHAW